MAWSQAAHLRSGRLKPLPPGPLLSKQQNLDLNPDLSDLRTPNSYVWCILKLKACEAWRHRQELDLALAFEEVQKDNETITRQCGKIESWRHFENKKDKACTEYKPVSLGGKAGLCEKWKLGRLRMTFQE